MAKYDWKQLEKEYILSDYKSVSSFLKDKEIPNNGSTKKNTKGWKSKKVLKDDKKSTKTIEKVIEKEAEKEANQIVKINDVANRLLSKILTATDELNKNVDMFGNMHEDSILNREKKKKLTSALKDVSDILENNNPKENNDGILNDLIGALKNEKDRRNAKS